MADILCYGEAMVLVAPTETTALAAGDFSAFKTAGHLAVYAGIAPVTRQSGTSIRRSVPVTGGQQKVEECVVPLSVGGVVS